MKKVISALALICFIILNPLAAFAAPPSVAVSDGGNVDCIIIVKKPETAVSTTTKKNYPLSAISLEGVYVFLYRYSAADGAFVLEKNQKGEPISTRIGASGLYLQQVDLNEGVNYLLLRAEYTPELFQNVRVDIKLLDQGIIDSIKGFSASFQSMLDGWVY